jgi:hypothetical protein
MKIHKEAARGVFDPTLPHSETQFHVEIHSASAVRHITDNARTRSYN